MKRSGCSTPNKSTFSGVNTHSISSTIVTPRDFHVTKVLFTLQWRAMTQILLALPVISLFVCLITSLIFHADHINNTICKVYNFLPSISAVTGVSPQRYLWRVCVALHISPRLLVAWVAREFYSSMATRVPAIHRPVYQGLVTLSFYLNLTELATLCGVTYISNKENYPVHEKLFMLFMLASLVYMVCVVRLLHTVQHALSPILLRSLAHKRWLLGTKIAATFGLLFFFWRHRVHCQPKAFSWFSLCEYVIATCNMLYHVSVALDFAEEHLIVGHIVTSSSSPVTSSLTTPESSSLVSSVTANSFNEYATVADRTPDVDLVLLEDTASHNASPTYRKREGKRTEVIEERRCLQSSILGPVYPLNSKDATHNHPLEPRVGPQASPESGEVQTAEAITQVLSTIHENYEVGGSKGSPLGDKNRAASVRVDGGGGDKDFLIKQRSVPATSRDWGSPVGEETANKGHLLNSLRPQNASKRLSSSSSSDSSSSSHSHRD